MDLEAEADVSQISILTGDSEAVLRHFPDNHFDAVVTDPPYGLGEPPDAVVMLREWLAEGRHAAKSKKGMMGAVWDAFVPQPALWREVLRVLKPGGFVVAFAGARTHDLMGLSLRLAGFEICDGFAWLFAQGMPKAKSHLKPAYEPVIRAQKPFKGSLVANVARHGTGGLNVKECKIGTDLIVTNPRSDSLHRASPSMNCNWHGPVDTSPRVGRWPANVLMDEFAAEALDEEVGTLQPSKGNYRRKEGASQFLGQVQSAEKVSPPSGVRDSGGPSRFFFQAKAASQERFAHVACACGERVEPRDDGLEAKEAPCQTCAELPKVTMHATQKPIALMQWLVRLICPPGGLLLDPFAGTGTTGVASEFEGRDAVLVDLDARYSRIQEHRVELARKTGPPKPKPKKPLARAEESEPALKLGSSGWKKSDSSS